MVARDPAARCSWAQLELMGIARVTWRGSMVALTHRPYSYYTTFESCQTYTCAAELPVAQLTIGYCLST